MCQFRPPVHGPYPIQKLTENLIGGSTRYWLSGLRHSQCISLDGLDSRRAVFARYRSPIPATNPCTVAKPSDRPVLRPHSPANASKVGFHSAGGGSSFRGTSCVALFSNVVAI